MSFVLVRDRSRLGHKPDCRLGWSPEYVRKSMCACHSVSVASRPAETRRRRGEIGSNRRSILVGHRRPNRRQRVITAMNEDQITHLGMFDLSAAFDTVDHTIMLKPLDVSFGIRENALNWFVSYLSGMGEVILASSVGNWAAAGNRAGKSFVSSLHFRSCCIGAELWFLGELTCRCIVTFFLDGKEQVALQLFRDCSESPSQWMTSNCLKLNPLKFKNRVDLAT